MGCRLFTQAGLPHGHIEVAQRFGWRCVATWTSERQGSLRLAAEHLLGTARVGRSATLDRMAPLVRRRILRSSLDLTGMVPNSEGQVAMRRTCLRVDTLRDPLGGRRHA